MPQRRRPLVPALVMCLFKASRNLLIALPNGFSHSSFLRLWGENRLCRAEQLEDRVCLHHSCFLQRKDEALSSGTCYRVIQQPPLQISVTVHRVRPQNENVIKFPILGAMHCCNQTPRRRQRKRMMGVNRPSHKRDSNFRRNGAHAT